jgi:hypothetical protein
VVARRLSARRLAVPLAALLPLSALAGCGASGRGSAAAATVERFQAALQHHDGDAACAQLSEDTEGKLEQVKGKPCPEAIFELELPPGQAAARTTVYVTSASVTLEQGGTFFLDEAPAGWEIASAGCHQTAPELPLECALEG